MRAAAALIALLSLGLGACNANPLLKAAASDYAPIRIGSSWDYKSPDGAIAVSRKVIGAGPYQGKEAFTLSTSVNAGPASLSYVAFEDGALLQYSASLGWILARRLPLANNNKWIVPSGSALVTSTMVVDGLEKVDVPVGSFEASFKVRTRTETYDPGTGVTSTAESLLWAAPGVGDVQFASLASDGTQTITLELVGYTIP